ncbi:MAG TPA: Gldg family protein [Candidatus Binataceae bacterium]|nr:Gldg family protein [Candidatus Binataceae bacterium]
MRRSSALYGILGLVLLSFGLIDYFISAGFKLFVWANVVAGVFALILWIMSSYSDLASLAGSRSTRYGLNALLYSIVFILILCAINYLGSLHHSRIDLTSEKVYSLSSQSVSVVKNLQKPLKLYGFFQGGESPQARDIYDMYAYASPKVTFEMVDPDKHPELAERYKVSVMGTTHLQYGGDEGDGTNVTDLSEEALTNAIVRVTRSTKKVIAFLDGHGEADIDSNDDPTGYGSIRKDLEGEGYEVRKLLLASQPKVADDINLLAIAGPVKPLLPHEIDALTEYLKRGGRVLVTLRPQRPDQPIDETALIKLLGDWGVTVDNDIIVDQVVRLFAGPELGLNPMVHSYGVHPITKDFTQQTVFPMARSIGAQSKLPDGLTVTSLAKTSDSSWGETDLDTLFRQQKAQLDAKDIRGPLTVAEAVEADLDAMKAGKGDAKIVVIGSTDFANNQYGTTFYNRDFFINSTDWLSGEENQISIRPRSIRASRFRLTVDQFAIVFALAVLLLPELLLIAGIAVWWERRN